MAGKERNCTRAMYMGILATVLVAGTAGGAKAQEPDCVTDLEILVAHTMQSYAGYPIEVRGRRDAEYAAMTTRVRGNARRATSTEACIAALREFTDWFHDPHLFVTEVPRFSEHRLRAFRDAAERRALTRDEAVAYIESRGAALDPVEGFWYDETAEIAVVRDPRARPARFVGVVVESSSEAWAPGDVRAWIRRVADGEYQIMLFVEDRSPRHVRGALYKDGLILRLAPHAWGRRAPVEPSHRGLLHPADPRAPTLSLRDSAAVVISIPSHDPKYRAALDSLLQLHADDLGRAATLVIDIRGNEGGSSRTTASLDGYLGSPTRDAPSRSVGPPVVLASPANRRAFERWTQWFDPVPAWLTNLLRDLEERAGELVSYVPSEGDAGTAEDGPDVVQEYPRRVGILIDEGVVSAGEAFVLKARRFDRVTVFGRPTKGSIDYQNVQLLPLASTERGFFLGYPTQAATKNLPEEGYNRTGVEPDVWLGPGVDDPVSFVLEHFD